MKIYSILSWLKYFFKAKTLYDLDSPFILGLVNSLNENHGSNYSLSGIENLRKEISSNTTSFERTDLGAGNDHSKVILVKDSLKSSSSKYKCQVLFKVANWAKPKRILELGTHFGFGSIALSAGGNTTLDTIEGDPFILELAKRNFEGLKIFKINTHFGSFDEILPKLLTSNGYELFYVDGFHTYDATLRFTKSITSNINKKFVIIFDDIYWSKEMYQAWKEIKQLVSFNYSVEYLGFGIIGFNPELKSSLHKIICPTLYKPWRMGFLRKNDSL